MSLEANGNTGDGQTGAETSVDDELRAAFAASVNDASNHQGDDGSASTAASTNTEDAASAAPKDGQQDSAIAATATDGKDAASDAKAPTPLEPIDAPAHWRAEDREMFSKQSPEAQRFLLNRDRDTAAVVTRKTQELAERGRGLDEIERVLTPRMQGFAMQGMTAGQVLNQLFTLSDFAEKDPVGFIQYFAQQRGVDPATLVSAAHPATPADPRDAQLREMQARFAKMDADRAESERRAAETQRSEIVNEITEFAGAKDATGAPLHPHFEAVRLEMSALMQANAAETLKTAYEKAVWANPQARAAEMARIERTKQAERDRADRERAAKARVAGSSITGRPAGSGASPAAFASVEEELRYHFTNGAGRL